VTAVAAWLSLGTHAFSGVDGQRIGLLPLSATAITTSIAVGTIVWWRIRRGASASPIVLLALVILPWMPLPLPSALLLWTGPMALLMWLAVALILFADIRIPARIVGSRPQPLVAGAVTFVLGAIAFWQVSPSVPAGDEPHYLVIAQSLIKDGDIRIENNHRQRDYRAYFAGDLPPDFRVRGRNGQIYSIHAPGVPAIIAPVFAIAGYSGTVFLLLLFSATTAALAWHLGWLVTGRADAAWFGWTSVVFSATFLFHSFTVYPDGVGALAVTTGVWALLRTEQERTSGSDRVRPWFLHGLALAALPWLHTRFAVLAGGLGALILLRLGRTPNALSKAGAFLAAPTISAIGWIGFFISVYGTPDPSAPYGGEPGSFAFVPDGLAGLLFDQRFGLLTYAPVLLVPLAGIGVMLLRPPLRRHALELLFVVVPYLVVVTYVAMWWGGTSAPARFFVPVLPWMAVPAAAAWTAMTNRATRALTVGALAFTAFASAVLIFVQGGVLAFNVRETYARWLEWLNGSVDLARGLPVWWRDRETPLFRGILVWTAVAAFGWLIVRRIERMPAMRPRARLGTAIALVAALCASLALQITWSAEGVSGRAAVPDQLRALRELSGERRLLALDLSRMRGVDRSHVASMMRIAPAFSTVSGGAGRNDRPLFIVPAAPAGDYRLKFSLREANGWVMVGIGRDQFALRTEPLASSDSMLVTFPVDVRAIIVRGDEDARRNVLGMTIEPLRVLDPSLRLTRDYARRAVHYPGAVVYFLDDRSFAEPEAFWTGGARETSVVIQPDTPRPSTRLLLRNGAAPNTILVTSGGWRDELQLGPGEERQVDVPLDQARGAALVHLNTRAGFRPSEVDPRSRDDRFLGLWVKVVN
jgi:hypothetical protein